jgi:hypothetical protein
MIETQLAQIVVAIPIDSNGKIPAQPENSCENVKAVTTRGGKTTHDPPNPNQSTGKANRARRLNLRQKKKKKNKKS